MYFHIRALHFTIRGILYTCDHRRGPLCYSSNQKDVCTLDNVWRWANDILMGSIGIDMKSLCNITTRNTINITLLNEL